MSYAKIRADIKALSDEKFRLVAHAKAQGRETNSKEDILIAEFDGAIQGLKAELEEPGAPLTQPRPQGAGLGKAKRDASIAGNGRDYKSFFNLAGQGLDNGGFKNCAEFLRVMNSGRFDPRLDIQAAQVEGTPSQGGFSVPSQFSSEWLDASLPTEIVRNLCRTYPMESETLGIGGWDGADMSAGATHGGFTMAFEGESQTATPQTAKVRQIELHARMGAIYVDASIELIQDGRNFETNLESALKKSIGYGIDRYAITGSGAGCPLGAINSACKIQVEKATGQAADTIVYSNLKSMFARQLNPQNAVWLFNATSIPDLLEQSVAVGVGGDFVPLLNEKDGKFHIFGRPVYFHAAMPAIGENDDCAFIDWNFYALGLRKEVWIDQTDAVRWLQREKSFRILLRFDGQCTLDQAIEPENGDTLSPIVTLGERV